MTKDINELFKIVDMLLLGGDVDEALDMLNQAVETAPESPLPYERRAELLFSMDGLDRTRQALADMERVVELGVDTIDLRFKMIVALADLGEIEAARVACAETIKRADSYPDIETRLREWGIRLALRADDLPGALEQVRLARQGNPDSIHWARQEAELLRDLGKFAAARDIFTALIDAHAPAEPIPGEWDAPKWAAIYLQRARTHYRLGAFEDALADVATAEANMPDDPGAPFTRGLIAWARGDVDAAFDLLRAGLKAAGENVRAGFWQELTGYPRLEELQNLPGHGSR